MKERERERERERKRSKAWSKKIDEGNFFRWNFNKQRKRKKERKKAGIRRRSKQVQSAKGKLDYK